MGLAGRRGADSVVFPVVRMSDRLDEFLPPRCEGDPLALCHTNLQVHKPVTVRVLDGLSESCPIGGDKREALVYSVTL